MRIVSVFWKSLLIASLVSTTLWAHTDHHRDLPRQPRTGDTLVVNKSTLADLASVLQAQGIHLEIARGLEKQPLLGRLAGRDQRAAIRRALTGYNFVMLGKHRVKVTGRNGNGTDPVVPLPRVLEKLPNPKAVRPFKLTPKQVAAVQVGDTITLQLPEGEVTAEVTRKHKGDLGSDTLVARLPGNGGMIVSYGTDDSVYGRIHTENGEYRVREDGQGGAVIFDLEEAGLKPTRRHDHAEVKPDQDGAITWRGLASVFELRDRVEKAAMEKAGGPVKAMAAAAPGANFVDTWAKNATVVDLLIYREPGLGNALLDFLVAATNQAFIDSRALIRVRTVHAETTSDHAQDAILDLLQQLSNSLIDSASAFGRFQNAAALRQQYGADVVAYLYNVGDASQANSLPDQVCGRGYISVLRNPDSGELYSLPAYAAFAMMVGYLPFDGETYPYCDESVFVHELGHVLGLDHDKSALALSDNQRAFPYAVGYFTGPDGLDFSDPNTFGSEAYLESAGTLMSYMTGGHLPWVFSNPGLDCFGHPCGRKNVADAVRALNQTRTIVAGYSPTKVTVQPVDPAGYRPEAVIDHMGAWTANPIWYGGNDQTGGEDQSVAGGDIGSDTGSDIGGGSYASCTEIVKLGAGMGNGFYPIRLTTGEVIDVYCQMEGPSGFDGFMLVDRYSPYDPIDYNMITYGIYDGDFRQTGPGTQSFSIWNAIDWGSVNGEIAIYAPDTNQWLLYSSATQAEFDAFYANLVPGGALTFWVR